MPQAFDIQNSRQRLDFVTSVIVNMPSFDLGHGQTLFGLLMEPMQVRNTDGSVAEMRGADWMHQYVTAKLLSRMGLRATGDYDPAVTHERMRHLFVTYYTRSKPDDPVTNMGQAFANIAMNKLEAMIEAELTTQAKAQDLDIPQRSAEARGRA